MNMREKIGQLERECEEYRQIIARAPGAAALTLLGVSKSNLSPEKFTPAQIDFLRLCGVRVVLSGASHAVFNDSAARAERALQQLRERLTAALEADKVVVTLGGVRVIVGAPDGDDRWDNSWPCPVCPED